MARTPKRKPAARRPARPRLVHQFLIVLNRTDPLVWRRIQVPETYSFWDLHVAIQDAMGWKDSHLHEFRLHDLDGSPISLGIPTDEIIDPERPMTPDWEVALATIFGPAVWHPDPVTYVYDFGDEWTHVVAHEGFEDAKASMKYPRCVAGARRCPPEDCGGARGYQEFLEAIADRKHPEHAEMLDWVGRAFDPDDFTPSDVVFHNPRKRWIAAFAELGDDQL